MTIIAGFGDWHIEYHRTPVFAAVGPGPSNEVGINLVIDKPGKWMAGSAHVTRRINFSHIALSLNKRSGAAWNFGDPVNNAPAPTSEQVRIVAINGTAEATENGLEVGIMLFIRD